MPGSQVSGVQAGPVVRIKKLATGSKFYFASVVGGMRTRRLKRVFRRAAQAEAYAREAARRLPFWRTVSRDEVTG